MKKKKKILTISTLVDKGGAAHIAKVIHDGLSQSEDFESRYLYGYSKFGFKAALDENFFTMMEYKLPIVPHLNFLFHNITGKDYFGPKESFLSKNFEWADIIICHTIHSYFLNYEAFFKLLRQLGKHIVLVCHDSWYYTGRCAFRYDCTGFKFECDPCQHLNYYPSTLFSQSKNEFLKKTQALQSLSSLVFVSPANWILADLNFVFPETDTRLIRNGIDTKIFKNLSVSSDSKVKFAVSCVDFKQNGKVDLGLIENLLVRGVEIHFIGRNFPFSNYSNAINHGYVSDRTKYLEILHNVNFYLFSSNVDIYPTVLIDAICSGCYIFYTDSRGANEIMNAEVNWRGSRIETACDIVDLLSDSEFISQTSNSHEISNSRNQALSFFDSYKMIDKYITLLSSCY